MRPSAPAVVVAADHAGSVEDTLTALAAQTVPVRDVLVAARSARDVVAAFSEPRWTATRWRPGWLTGAGMPAWAAVLRAGDVPFADWAEHLADLAQEGPAALFGRMAQQPARLARSPGVPTLTLATGPISVTAELFTAALPAPVAAVTPLGWWETAAPDRAPAGLVARSSDAVLALRHVVPAPTRGIRSAFRLR